MSIFVDETTRLCVQGITGRDGAFHAKGMIEYGTNVVSGVTPGKGGEEVEGVPRVPHWRPRKPVFGLWSASPRASLPST